MSANQEIKLAEKKLHDMSIDEQKDMYGDEKTMNDYFVNLAGRIRKSVNNGYLLPEGAERAGKV